MNTAEKLRAAKALIADQKNWCQGVFYRIGENTQRCGIGALDISNSAINRNGPERELLEKAAKVLYGTTVYSVNDHIGHPAVMAVYSRAIELAEAANAPL